MISKILVLAWFSICERDYTMALKLPRKLLLVIVLTISPVFSAADWKPTEIPLTSRWTDKVSVDRAWPEYPRPQLIRGNWINLNGLWDYTIQPKEQTQPTKWEGKILVPYPVESALSGVGRFVRPEHKLWYRRTFITPKMGDNQRLRLNFGAVDWHSVVYVNGKCVGANKGGYLPFSFDITDHLEEKTNELIVEVYDPTNVGIQPHGKQTLNPSGIFYTPTTGIWQTAWLEIVPRTYITALSKKNRFTIAL
jgi:beta-galactosidase/beta-glucuronidase